MPQGKSLTLLKAKFKRRQIRENNFEKKIDRVQTTTVEYNGRVIRTICNPIIVIEKFVSYCFDPLIVSEELYA